MVDAELSAAHVPAVFRGGLQSVDCPGSVNFAVVRAIGASVLSVRLVGQVGQPCNGGPSNQNACGIGV